MTTRSCEWSDTVRGISILPGRRRSSADHPSTSSIGRGIGKVSNRFAYRGSVKAAWVCPNCAERAQLARNETLQ